MMILRLLHVLIIIYSLIRTVAGTCYLAISHTLRQFTRLVYLLAQPRSGRHHAAVTQCAIRTIYYSLLPHDRNTEVQSPVCLLFWIDAPVGATLHRSTLTRSTCSWSCRSIRCLVTVAVSRPRSIPRRSTGSTCCRTDRRRTSPNTRPVEVRRDHGHTWTNSCQD